ncbi:MAG: hypothetical protein P8N02_00775 [Actinomycetota bacterium]|nr:hypothetical protein [Actinomycetota bacterium]
MSELHDVVGPDRRMVVTTSLCANPDDRTMTRSDIAPVQLLTGHGFAAIDWLQPIGDLGLSALTIIDDNRLLVVDGDVIHVAQHGGGISELDGNYRDLHEVIVDGDEILAANTGNDEVVVLDRNTLTELRRVRPRAAGRADDAGEVDRFHLNQGLRLPSGELVALVHHVNGRQLVTRLKARVLKSHGNGGVAGLEGAPDVQLNLAAPHNIRVLSDGFLVFDSGRALGRRYDSSWKQVLEFETAGWGRGCTVDESADLVYIGSSPPRLRYKKQLQGRATDRPIIEARRLSDGQLVASEYVADCEQINNLYLFGTPEYERHFRR